MVARLALQIRTTTSGFVPNSARYIFISRVAVSLGIGRVFLIFAIRALCLLASPASDKMGIWTKGIEAYSILKQWSRCPYFVASLDLITLITAPNPDKFSSG